MRNQKLPRLAIGIIWLAWLLAGCGGQPAVSPTSTPPASPTPQATSVPSTVARTAVPTQVSTTAPTGALSVAEVATLNSLERVDDYPLYTMHYQGDYRQQALSNGGVEAWASADRTLFGRPAWACSLFAALGDPNDMLYGRNFDWDYSPALVLFTDPPDGYASVSMVDIAYLGFGSGRAGAVADLPLAERRALLYAPFIPFDGLNEHGLVVGMAAVPPGNVSPDPNKPTLDSLRVIREMLDHARTADEAVALLRSYNVDMGGGPPVHYLVADRSGHAVLVEFYQGKSVVMPNEGPWHLATNFLRASVESPAGQCWRYDKLSQHLTEAGGRLTPKEAMDLLAAVGQEITQWSVVYEMNTGQVHVVMGRQYGNPHAFHLGLAG